MSKSLMKLLCCGAQDLYTQKAIKKLNSFYKVTDGNKKFAEQRKHLTELFNKISRAYITSGLIEQKVETFPNVLKEFNKTYDEYIKKYNLPDDYIIQYFKI